MTSNSPCRLCAELCNSSLDCIFSDDNVPLVEIIQKYLSIHITIKDLLPIQICTSCRSRLTSFDEYAHKCALTQITLSSVTDKQIDNDDKNSIKPEDNLSIKDYIKEEFSDQSVKSEEDSHFIDDDDDDSYSEKSSRRKSKRKTSKSRKSKKSKGKKNKLALKKKEMKIQNVSQLAELKLDPLVKIESDLKLEDENIDLKKKGYTLNNSLFMNFVCHICHEEFSKWSDLFNHTNQIHNTKPKILCTCSKYLRSKQNVYKHIKKHSFEDSIYKCLKCKSSFLTEKYYTKHLLTHAIGNIFKCEHCDKTFAKNYKLKIHERNHLPKEERMKSGCEICGGRFASNHALQLHVRTVHNKERSFVCDICGKAFTTKGNLKSHLLFHTAERPFPCPHCPKTYKSSRNLRRHTDAHEGVKYKCSKCPSTFSYEKTLKEHMYVHLDVFRFICGFCNKGFKWKRSFESHLNLHTGKTPFSCPWCPKTFADGSNCRIHKRRKHPVELAEYEAINGPGNPKMKQVSTGKKIIRSLKNEIIPKPKVFPKIDNAISSDTDDC